MVRGARMVDVTPKEESYRVALAYGRIRLRRETVDRIRRGDIEKGDPIAVASIAGVLAAKNTPNIVLLCHPLPLTNVEVTCHVEDEEHIGCTARVSAVAKTGVEMEALAAVASALLNIWDVVKKYEKDEDGQYPYTRIEEIRVLEKRKEPTTS